MIDVSFLAWIENENYSSFPKEKWCDMDYMAVWIRECNYKPKTSMENLIINIINAYRADGFDRRSFPNALMIHIPTVSLYVQSKGGLESFDYK